MRKYLVFLLPPLLGLGIFRFIFFEKKSVERTTSQSALKISKRNDLHKKTEGKIGKNSSEKKTMPTPFLQLQEDYPPFVDKEFLEKRVNALYSLEALGLENKLLSSECFSLLEILMEKLHRAPNTMHEKLLLLDLLGIAKICVQVSSVGEYGNFIQQYEKEVFYKQLSMAL